MSSTAGLESTWESASPLVAEIRTPSPYRVTTPTGGNFSMSASLTALDLHTDPLTAAVLVLGVGSDAHANLGSSGGMRYLWRVVPGEKPQHGTDVGDGDV